MNTYKLLKIEREITLQNGNLLTKLLVQNEQNETIKAVVFGREPLALGVGQSFQASTDNQKNERGEIKLNRIQPLELPAQAPAPKAWQKKPRYASEPAAQQASGGGEEERIVGIFAKIFADEKMKAIADVNLRADIARSLASTIYIQTSKKGGR